MHIHSACSKQRTALSTASGWIGAAGTYGVLGMCLKGSASAKAKLPGTSVPGRRVPMIRRRLAIRTSGSTSPAGIDGARSGGGGRGEVSR